MSDKFTLDVGLALDLKNAFRRAGWSAELVKQLSAGDVLRGVRDVILGRAVITPAAFVVDCDAAPFVPDRCVVEEHKKGGQFAWDPAEVELFFTESQKRDGQVESGMFRQEIAGLPVLNANVLDFLLAHPHLIPAEWERLIAVSFWGTIYSVRGGNRFVRCLVRVNDKWTWIDECVDNNRVDNYPTALRANRR